MLGTIMRSGHFSTLEHVSYTFAVDGVSRALTHQLVRHRLASFNQQSQRYVKFTNGLDTVKPASVSGDAEASRVFDEAIEQAKEAYARLVELGVPAEDARYLLPNAAETKIVITMNVRELLHFFELRCCNRAQWEIRDLAHRMLELVRPTAPFVFLDAGAPCVHGSCPEGRCAAAILIRVWTGVKRGEGFRGRSFPRSSTAATSLAATGLPPSCRVGRGRGLRTHARRRAGRARRRAEGERSVACVF